MVPIILLLYNAIAIPESSFSGHLLGIVAAVVLMYGGVYSVCLLPHYEWIQDWEKSNWITWL